MSYKSLHKLNNIFFHLIVCLLISTVLTSAYFIFSVYYLPKISVVDNDLESEYVQGIDTNIIQLNLKKTKENNYNFRVSKTDFREIVFDYYLELNESPLSGLGSKFVESCEKYGAPNDCTTVLAIARIETDLCKYGPSQVQQNCWGFGGSGENRYYFSSYEDGIDLVTERLVFGYGNYYMINPNEMEMTYCGPRESCRTWGDKVQREMDNINNLSESLGYRSLYSMRQ